MSHISFKEAEASEYNIKHGDIRMVTKKTGKKQTKQGVPFVLVRPLHDFESPRYPQDTFQFMVMIHGLDVCYRVVNGRIQGYATGLDGKFLLKEPNKGDEESNRVELKDYQKVA